MDANDLRSLSALSAPTDVLSDTYKLEIPPSADIYDVINHPQHYEVGGIECIDAMVETQGTIAVMDFCICNAFKYLWRHGRKGGIEDVRKAQWYLNKYCELAESEKVIKNG